MAATEARAGAALAALTSAALGLPGLQAVAATAAVQARASFHAGHYEESGDRIAVDVARADFVIPINERLELTASLIRDTYSGATPAYSVPRTMTGRLQYAQRSDGSPAGNPIQADVVTAASGGASAGGLTVLGGINTFKDFVDAGDAARASFIAANPRPPSPAPPPSIPGPLTLGFEGMTFASYFGAANAAPAPGGACPGVAVLGCYSEGGMVVGLAADASNPVAHLHRTGGPGNRILGYHADSSGIYLRALDGAAFGLTALSFSADLDFGNPDSGPVDFWEILGFNQAVNPDVSDGNGTDYAGRVAYQKVANGFDDRLVLDPAFANVNAVWIHYQGYPRTPADGKAFDLQVDDIELTNVTTDSTSTPEQIAWEQALQRFVGIEQFRAVVDTLVPEGTPAVQRTQIQAPETRSEGVLGARYYFDEATLGLSAGVSYEPDFRSTFAALELSRDLNDGHTTLSANLGVTRNAIRRAGTSHADHHASDPEHNPTAYPSLDESSTFHSISLGIGQVLDRHTVVRATAGYTREAGYLSNPYKLVYVRGEITPEEYYDLWQAGAGEVDWKAVTDLEVVGIELFREVRPRERHQRTLSLGLNRHFPGPVATGRLDYRYYNDDWGVRSHTLAAEWHQALRQGFILTPRIRYYSQSQADFFAPYFLEPRVDGLYSSDYRLSAYGALSAGLTAARTLGRGLRIEAGLEYYTHRGELRLGGGGEEDYADFDAYLAHIQLDLDLSTVATGAAGGGHHRHLHDGPVVPAGVADAPMTARAGDLMVGYEYRLSHQGGDMRRGNHRVGDRELVEQACGTRRCGSRPTSMTMGMHMFHLMWAPADGVTLGLMPHFMDMDMELEPIAGANVFDSHGGGHRSTGLGDTRITGQFRLLEKGSHRLHLGLGLSAPTGDVEVTLDGSDGPGSLLQDYGMQLGSGTWDLHSSLTYTGIAKRWSWGGQLATVRRLEGRNDAGYRLGDELRASAWAGYGLGRGLTATLRGLYTDIGGIRGTYDRPHTEGAPVDWPGNYGGELWDLGIGLSTRIDRGAFAGHGLAVEWLQPVASDYDGYQIEREGTLVASWRYHF